MNRSARSIRVSSKSCGNSRNSSGQIRFAVENRSNPLNWPFGKRTPRRCSRFLKSCVKTLRASGLVSATFAAAMKMCTLVALDRRCRAKGSLSALRMRSFLFRLCLLPHFDLRRSSHQRSAGMSERTVRRRSTHDGRASKSTKNEWSLIVTPSE
jgi:hypothetical protein